MKASPLTPKTDPDPSRAESPRPRPNSPGAGSAPESSLLRSARRVFLVMGVIIALMEIIQHLQLAGFELDLLFIAEVLFYIVLLPFMGFVVLRQIDRSERARLQASERLIQQYALVRQLSSMSEWNELLSRVVELPHFFSPVSSTALYLRSADGSSYNLAVYWSEGTDSSSALPAAPLAQQVSCAGDACAPGVSALSLVDAGAKLYSLALCPGEAPVGVLQMTLSAGQQFSPLQVETLEGMAVDLALVLDRAALRSVALHQAQANLAERQGIARNLHDTLAQNIAYLRLKLEELVLEDNPSRQIVLIRKELSRMRDIADEAYHQVREAVADLHREENRDLAQVLLERALTVGERAGFSAKLRQRGVPRPLDLEIRRQAVYVCREALNNIEKYSRCSEVLLEMIWGEETLEINVIDNGSGFEPTGVNQRDHYGLMIMKERAATVGGKVEVFSTVGEGTTISLNLPYTLERTPVASGVVAPKEVSVISLWPALATSKPPSDPTKQ